MRIERLGEKKMPYDDKAVLYSLSLPGTKILASTMDFSHLTPNNPLRVLPPSDTSNALWVHPQQNHLFCIRSIRILSYERILNEKQATKEIKSYTLGGR